MFGVSFAGGVEYVAYWTCAVHRAFTTTEAVDDWKLKVAIEAESFLTNYADPYEAAEALRGEARTKAQSELDCWLAEWKVKMAEEFGFVDCVGDLIDAIHEEAETERPDYTDIFKVHPLPVYG